MIESVAVDAGDKNICVAIIVIVADGHAHVVAAVGGAGFFSDVGEMSLAVIFKKTVAEFGEDLRRVWMSAPLVKKMSSLPSLL